jgi:ABC-2 type transport system permease protein
MNYLSATQTVVEIGDSDEEIQDALYYQKIDYSLRIKSGFEQKLSAGETDGLLENVKKPGTYTATLIDAALTEYISAAQAYIVQGETAAGACEKATLAMSESTDVTYETFGGQTNYLGYFMQYAGYIFICITLTCFSPILVRLNSGEIKRRISCSPISSLSKTIQTAFAAAMAVIAEWLIFMLLAAAVYRGEMLCTSGALAALNSLAFIASISGIMLLVAQFNLSETALPMISNVVSLGISFICGIFVPQSLLGSGVLRAARVLPAYWYVLANNMIFGYCGEKYEVGEFVKCVVIQLIFAIVLIAVSAGIAKIRQKRSE